MSETKKSSGNIVQHLKNNDIQYFGGSMIADRKHALIVLLFISLFIVIIPASGDSISFTDALGREITLDKPAERIGFQFYGVGEALKIVGAWDKVVARDGYISDEEFYPGFENIPAINPESGEMELDYEKIVEINPDVMIIQNEEWYADKLQEAVETLDPEIKVVVLDFVNPNTMAENFVKLGQITGNNQKAQEFADYYTDIVSPIQKKAGQLSESEKPSVLIKAAGYSADQLCTYGSGMAGWENILAISGGKNAAHDLSFGFGDIDPEWLMSNDYDVLIDEIWNIYCPESFEYQATDPQNARAKGEELRSQVMNEEEFSGSTAVKNGDVYLVDHALFGTIRQVVLIPYLAKWLHPDLFGDLNPEAIHQEYLDRFIGADYDLKEVGIFVYPE